MLLFFSQLGKIFVTKQKYAFWFGGVALVAISPFITIPNQSTAWAGTLGIGSSCPIPDSVADQATVIASFLNSSCTKVTLTQETTFYRYYNNDNTYRFGRYLTTNFYSSSNGDTTLDVIQELALAQYFGPPPNLAQFREKVTVPAGLDVYIGVAGPQRPKSCYPGGGSQVFTPITRDVGISFDFDGEIPSGGTLEAKCYKNPSIPEPSPLFGLGAIAILGFAATFKSKPKQEVNA